MATVITISRMRHLGSFVLYVAVLAVSDNLAIVVKVVFYQVRLHEAAIGPSGFCTLQYLGMVFSSYCSWVLVLMAIERLVAVRYPFRIHYQSCLTVRKTAAALGALLILICVLTAPMFWAADFDASHVHCRMRNVSLLRAMHWTTISVDLLVPFSLLAISNFLLARDIRSSFQLRNAIRRGVGKESINGSSTSGIHYGGWTSSGCRRSCDVPVQRQIMVMLFTATFMFVLLKFPICSFVLIDVYWNHQNDCHQYAWKYTYQQLAYVLTDSNHAVNFYLYFLSARKFRKHFTHLVLSCFSCNKQQKCSQCRVRERLPLQQRQT